MSGPRGRQRGTSLVEAFVVAGIAVLFVTGMVTAQGRDALFVGESLREQAARRACAARLEALLADRASLAGGTRPMALEAGDASALGEATGEESLREVEPGLYEVEVRVTWGAAGGERRTTVLRTLVAGGGER